jgi:hypothetical protein
LNHIAPVGRGSIVAWTYEAQVMIKVAIGMIGAGFIGHMHSLTFSAVGSSRQEPRIRRLVTLRPWKRTLSASDSEPTPRRAKSNFLSVQ